MIFVISAVTTTQCSMKKLEKLSLKKNHANHNFVIYIFVNAQKVVHPRGFNHMSFVISAVTTTQCSMKKLEKLSLKKNLANHTGLTLMILVYWSFVLALILSSVRVGSPSLAWRLWRRGKWGIGGGRRGGGEGELGKGGEARAREHN